MELGQEKGNDPASESTRKSDESVTVISKEMIPEILSDSGGCTRAVAETLGIDWPLVKGWRERLLGMRLDRAKWVLARQRRNTNSGLWRKQRTAGSIDTTAKALAEKIHRAQWLSNDRGYGDLDETQLEQIISEHLEQRAS